MVKTKINASKSTYVWNARVMKLARRVGNDIRSRENNEKTRGAVINTTT